MVIIVLGLWGALIPFVGPYFDYSFGTNSTWQYTSDRLWLDILPGAVAILGGLLLLTSNTRVRGTLGGWLAIIAGAWFAIGPAVSMLWENGRGPIGAPLGGSTRQTVELLGYFYGLGALIVALGAFAAGRFASRPRLAEDVAEARARVTVPPPVTAAEPATTTPAGTAPAGTTPPGVAPAGLGPVGTTPAGTTPAGTTPAGTTPAGTTPTGTTPAGTAPVGGTDRRHPPRRRAWPFARGRATTPRGGRRS